ncbi:MATE family efflux transporter [Vibrio scophthalmi]|uniref:Multidrug resistance protein NorM n=1 Tax=Vibrio scophthalmi TaxID=45658 RepID=A0A1E3WG95_9VIBR|nr:MATE family efflux transporter [Vibrio scophthalmi]ODS04838.1 putative multidrug resistance protein NorM [Vibrio scophthalmi]
MIATTPDRTFFQNLIKIGLPVSLQSMLFSLLGVTDILMVSQLGEAATAAVGVGNRIFFFNLIVVCGVSGAVSVLASQYFGAKNMDGVRITLFQSIFVAILVTAPFSLWYIFDSEQVVSIVSDNSDYIFLASDYLWITASTLICTAICVPLEGALRAIGQAKLPTQVSIYAILLNLLLNTLLIFGLFGFPELGVVGAAIGTSVSRLFQTLLLSYIVVKRFPCLIASKENMLQAKTSTHRRRYLKIGLPMIIHDSAWAGGILFYNVLIGQLGVTELAIFSLLAPIESVIFSAFLGFAVAASVILANEIGANQYQRVEQTAWWYVFISTLAAFSIALVCFAAKPLLLSAISLTPISDPIMATNTFIIMLFGMGFRVFNMVAIGGVLKSGGDINYSIFIDLFGQWAIGIPLAYFTGIVLGWSLEWVIAVVMLEEIAKIFLSTQRIRSKKWINNLVQDEPNKITKSIA